MKASYDCERPYWFLVNIMSLQDLIPSDLFTYAAYMPGFGGALLALYNWYQMRRGAVVKLNQPVNFGLIRDVEKDGAINYYFPLLTYNEGSKAGMITDVSISFKSEEFEKRIDISRRVEMVHEEGTEEEDTSIIGAEPMFPFFISADEGNVAIFECVDYDHEVIPLNKSLTCRINITYDHKKKSSIEFPFQLYSEEISLLLRGNMKWLKPKIQAEKPGTVADRDHLRSLLQEMNMEDEYEVILDREGTHFDRTVKYNGTKIVRLDLSDLKIAALPDSIQNFELLEYLDLSNNFLTQLPEGIGNLNNLKELEVGRNKGLTTIPSSIGQLSNLKFLGFYGDNLTSLPDTIGNLSSLEWLQLSGNQLQRLPDTICTMSSLTRLDINDNGLESLPENFGALLNLVTLEIKKNKLKSVPASLLKNKKLTVLNFEQNSIQSFPSNLIRDGEHLTGLQFNDNEITSLPEGFEKLERLSVISVRNNPLNEISESVNRSLELLKNRGCNVYLD